jgi:hypothetical protein
MVVTTTHFASQTAVIHVLPVGATHEDFLRSNDVVPVATYAATPVSSSWLDRPTEKPGISRWHGACIDS